MAIRNSYVELRIDGRGNIGTGPANKQGTMNAQFLVRENGDAVKSVRVATFVYGNELHLTVFDPEGNIVYNHITLR